MPINLALVIHGFDTGGSERFVARLVDSIDRARFLPSIISFTTLGTASRWIKSSDVEIHALKKRSGNDLLLIKRFARLLRNQNIDIVHSHNWGTLIETSLASRWAGTFAHVHAERGTVLGDLNVKGLKRVARARLTRWCMGRADAIVSVANATRNQITESCGLSMDRVQVITNGVQRPPTEDGGREKIRSELGIRANTTLVGSLGRLDEIKNHEGLLGAMEIVCRQRSNIEVVLVGDGPKKNVLVELAGALNLQDRVHFVGQRQDVGNWLSAMDIHVNCSRSEGLSQSVLEALSLGVPQVVTDVGDHAWVIQGSDSCGEVVPAGDTASLATQIERLVDPDLRSVMSINAIERFESQFQTSTMVQAYERLYTSILERKGVDMCGKAVAAGRLSSSSAGSIQTGETGG